MTYLITYDTPREDVVDAASLREAGRVADTRKRRGERVVGIHERPGLTGPIWRQLVADPDLLHRKERPS